jgi:uncharacterized membrane protein
LYLVLKLLHVASVIAFLGNITSGLFWHAHAARTRDPGLLAHAVDGIIRSDRMFTVPGVIGIVVTGLATAIHGRLPILRTDWILGTIVLFTISGILFGWRVAPLQRRMHALALAGTRSGSFDYPGYHAVAVRWEAWGAVTLLAPIAGLVLMVLKPGR